MVQNNYDRNYTLSVGHFTVVISLDFCNKLKILFPILNMIINWNSEIVELQVLGIEITLHSNSLELVFQEEKYTAAGRAGIADMPHVHGNPLAEILKKEHGLHG